MIDRMSERYGGLYRDPQIVDLASIGSTGFITGGGPARAGESTNGASVTTPMLSAAQKRKRALGQLRLTDTSDGCRIL